MKSLCIATVAAAIIATTANATPLSRPIPFDEMCIVDGAFNDSFGPESRQAGGVGYPTLSLAIYSPWWLGTPEVTGFAVAAFASTTISITFTDSGIFQGDPNYNAMYFSTVNFLHPPPGGDAPNGGLTITGIDSQTNMPGFTTENLFHPEFIALPGVQDIELAGLSYDTNSRIVLDVALVPAPGSLTAMLIGVLGLLTVRGRRRPI